MCIDMVCEECGAEIPADYYDGVEETFVCPNIDCSARYDKNFFEPEPEG